jgi:hypothetical protein
MPDSGNGSIAKRRRDDERYAEKEHPDNKRPKISALTKGAQQEDRNKDVRRSGRSNGRPDYAAMSSYGSRKATGSTAAKGFQGSIGPEDVTPLVSDDEDGQDDEEMKDGENTEEGKDGEEDEEEGEDEDED